MHILRAARGLIKVTILSIFLTISAFAQVPNPSDTCLQGYVWREAFSNDHVCVTPDTRARVAQDNSKAAARRQPGGGAYGPNTCIQGYVWREATPNDLVCVTPEVRAQTASDNAAAASRRTATKSSASGTPPATGYKTGEWSGWARDADVEYRYRWGSNLKDSGWIDAMFQIRNTQKGVWRGAARSLRCSENVISMGKDVVIQPNETQEVKFSTQNCGTKDKPSFRPNIVKSVRID